MKLDTRPAATPPAPSLPRHVPGAPHRPSRWRRRRVLVGAVCLVLLLVALVAVTVLRSAGSPVEVPTAPVGERIVARGEVRPVQQARVGTLEGGVVRQLLVEPGDTVEEQQEIGRVRGAQTTEVLTAPLRGTVTDVLVRVGDTVTPGTIVATIGDLSRLQVETTDVDEFIVAQLHRGQAVTLTFEALDRRQLQGTVRSVALVPRLSTAGDAFYPVVIDLAFWPPDLRPGMTARLAFGE